jgi:predicted metal-dependent phosphoesterase TrpH
VTRKLSGDARLMLWVCAGVLAVIVVGAFFAPAREDTDPVPSTWNSGSQGAKAAYLLLGQLGYSAARWDKPAAALSEMNAAHTTLILAQTDLADANKEKAGIADFLNRGGRVVATGAMSALMLPESHIGAPDHIYTALCYTTPQSLSLLARAGQVAMPVPVRWKAGDANSYVDVDQACGEDAVVVHYPVGAGEVVWWSSAAPLSNRGLRNDADLRLLMASVGAPGTDKERRTVLFDEYIHGEREGIWATISGTPVKALCWQLAAVALLLVLSFGRRNGPLRALTRQPRTSPLEFAESMGALYEKAGVAHVAAGAAERRLMDFLHREGGIPQETLRSTPDAIAAAVAARFFYTTPDFAADLEAAREAEFNRLSAKGALELVRRIDRHIAKLTALMTDSHAAQKNGETRD